MGFKILKNISTLYPKHRTTGLSLPMQLTPATESNDPLAHVEKYIRSLTLQLFERTIRKVIWLPWLLQIKKMRFQGKSQIKDHFIWSLVSNVTMRSARWAVTDMLEVRAHSVYGCTEWWKYKIWRKNFKFSLFYKTAIVMLKTKVYCLAYALVITKAIADNYARYKAYTKGNKRITPVQEFGNIRI